MHSIRTWRHMPALLASVCSCLAGAQTISVPTAQFEASSNSTRSKAFYSVMAIAARLQPNVQGGYGAPLVAQARQQADLRFALIRLLERENAVLAKAWPAAPADFDGEGYYPDLAYTVAGLHDPRAVFALIPAVSLGDRVEAGLAALGEASVSVLVQALHDSDWKTRSGAVRALGKIVAQKNELRITDASMTSIGRALLQVAEDHTSADRKSAIVSLMPISDPEVRTVMVRLAQDTTQTRHGVKGPISYPLRDAARQWLRAHPF